MSKRPLGHGDIRGMSNFKAIAMDYAYYLTLSDEGSLYCLTDRQIYILLAQLDYVGWMTRWYNTEDINQTTVGLIRSELELALLSCVDVSIIVEQGKQNLTRNVQQQLIESQRLRDEYQDRYDGDPTSINPNAPTTNFGASGDRFQALCSALMAYVYQAANAQVQALIAGDIAAYALLAGAAVLLIPGLNLFYIAGASLALLAGGGIIGVTTGTAIAALTDTTALDAVVCYMRDQLKAQSVSEANFAAVLNSYPFSPGSHEAIICDFLKGQLGSNYLGMLDMLGQGYQGTTGDDPLPDCPCDDGCGPAWSSITWYEGIEQSHSGDLYTIRSQKDKGGFLDNAVIRNVQYGDWGNGNYLLTSVEMMSTGTVNQIYLEGPTGDVLYNDNDFVELAAILEAAPLCVRFIQIYRPMSEGNFDIQFGIIN